MRGGLLAQRDSSVGLVFAHLMQRITQAPPEVQEALQGMNGYKFIA